MRTLISAAAGTLLCLVAAPAMAQSVSDAEANQILAAMETPASSLCADSDRAKAREPIEHFNTCQTALGELAAFRQKNAKASPGQKEVYKFFEASLEMGNTFALLRVDSKPTPRVCANIEKQWALANQTNVALVGPQLADAINSTKLLVRPLVELCRSQFPAPQGAIPL